MRTKPTIAKSYVLLFLCQKHENKESCPSVLMSKLESLANLAIIFLFTKKAFIFLE